MTHRYHNSFDPACKTPFGAVEAGQTVTLRLFVPAGESCTDPSVRVYEADRWQIPAATVAMVYDHTTPEGCRCFRAEVTPPFAGLYYYCFMLTVEGRRRRLLRGPNGDGVFWEQGGLWQLTVTQPGFTTPDRFKGGVMYQIFPDRFCSSGTERPLPAGREWHSSWKDLPKYLPDPDGVYRPNDFFGGDLKGIESKLDYLQELGVTTLYLNPIFEAHSNHRYNTADYRAIDPTLGTEEDFARLCAAAKQRGMDILLDGVFSHTGSDSIYFNREGRYNSLGAYQSKESPYYSWFSFHDHPNGYASWWGFQTLPEVKENDPAYLDYICGTDGVLHKWMDLGAAGWRLDVADELPDEFLDALRRSVKRKDPQALVLGEVWEDASCKEAYGQRRRYLLGDQLDSVMNYPFRNAILDFVSRGDSEAFWLQVLQVLDHYPKCVCDVLMNFLSTHDVERAMTLLGGEAPEGRDRRWQGEHHHLNYGQKLRGEQRLRAAALLQYTLPGIPCLYYGDEAGMYGYRDPFNRCCYPWGEENSQLVDFFKALGSFRREHALFAKGRLLPLWSSHDCCVFLREEGGEGVLTAVNAGQQDCRISLPRGFLLDGSSFVAGSWYPEELRLGPCSGVLLGGRLQHPQEY